MIKNYLKIAWRSILKNKGVFFINTIGLALGITTCLLISLFVFHELSFDRFHEKHNEIARVILKGKLGDELVEEASVMAPVAQALVNDLPEVTGATRILKVSENTKATYKENTLRKGQLVYVDANFLDVFTFPLIKGNAATALSLPNSVILTQQQAEAYFGNEDPLNKTIEIKDIGLYTASSEFIDTSGAYTVTGVMENIPDNSHFHFDMFASMASYSDSQNQNWLSGSYHTYLLLDKDAQFPTVETKLRDITIKYMGPQLEKAMGMTFDQFEESGSTVGLYLQPLNKIHLYTDIAEQFEAGGSIKTVYLFGMIALFMLLIACFNFMNLATASASKRIKEIGMRKVLGSQKKQLVFQFLLESLIATTIAMAIGLFLVFLILPYFNGITEKSFSIQQLLHPTIVAVLIGFTLLISIIAGAYPAFFMSRFEPIRALKSKFLLGNSKSIRSGLVVFQFAISICLIIGTIVVNMQMDYILNKDIGYDREELIVVRHAGLLGNKLKAFKEELEKDPRILRMTTSAFVPAGPSDNFRTVLFSKENPQQLFRAKVYHIDEQYIPTLGIQLLSGRNFAKTFGSEKGNVIINETAINTFGLNQNPIGQTLKESIDLEKGATDLTVVGVVKDFHSRSLHEPIEPLLMKYNPYYGLIVKGKHSTIPGILASMKNHWDSFGTGESFDYAFLDALYNETYEKEQNVNSIVSIFALMTIFIACLGLFGLITFTAQQRFKEIGIRKVLGSSILQVMQLLAGDFIKLIFIAMLIAFPLGYFLMENWLKDFSYRIDIHWGVFVFSGLLTLLIAFATIGWKSFMAAKQNPVKSLRTE